MNGQEYKGRKKKKSS